MQIQKIKVLYFIILLILSAVPERSAAAEVEPKLVPAYVTAGLAAYKTKGYEAAVHIWLADSPHKDAVNLVSNLMLFKNIQMLAGKYLSYDILMTQETVSSNLVYVRMNYERVPGYILFTSLKRDGKWVLGSIKTGRLQNGQSIGA
jgi:hypothetical protein